MPTARDLLTFYVCLKIQVFWRANDENTKEICQTKRRRCSLICVAKAANTPSVAHTARASLIDLLFERTASAVNAGARARNYISAMAAHSNERIRAKADKIRAARARSTVAHILIISLFLVLLLSSTNDSSKTLCAHIDARIVSLGRQLFRTRAPLCSKSALLNF